MGAEIILYELLHKYTQNIERFPKQAEFWKRKTENIRSRIKANYGPDLITPTTQPKLNSNSL